MYDVDINVQHIEVHFHVSSPPTECVRLPCQTKLINTIEGRVQEILALQRFMLACPNWQLLFSNNLYNWHNRSHGNCKLVVKFISTTGVRLHNNVTDRSVQILIESMILALGPNLHLPSKI